MSGSGGRNVTLYDRGFGELGNGVDWGKSQLHSDGSSHNSVGSNENSHFSWDQQADGGVRGEHFVDTGYSKGNPSRHPFDR